MKKSNVSNAVVTALDDREKRPVELIALNYGCCVSPESQRE
jgi:hypothetical protein